LFKVTYLQQEGAAFVNATAQLATGRTGSFQSGAETSYRIIVTPGRSASGKRSGYQFQLRGVSNNDGTKVDRVNGQVVNRIR
jgi:hypothetical protein